MFLRRTSILATLTSHPAEEGHGWVWRLLERVPTGQGVIMSTIRKIGTDILPTPPPFPADSCAHGATKSPVWRLALLSFLPLSLGLAGPVWADGNVRNLNLSGSKGYPITNSFPSAQSFTTGNHSAGYTLLAMASNFTTESTPNLIVADITRTKATFSLSNHTGTWYLKGGDGVTTLANCVAVSGGSSHTLSNLSGNRTYTFSAFSTAGCDSGGRLDQVNFTTPGSLTMLATASTATTVEIVLHGHDGTNWYARVTPDGGPAGACNNMKIRSRNMKVGLSPNTSYTIEAFWSEDCAFHDRFATASFTTKPAGYTPPVLTVSDVGQTTATLTLTNYDSTKPWWYELNRDASNCEKVAAGIGTVTVSGLARSRTHTIVAYSQGECDNAASDWRAASYLTTTGLVTIAISNKSSRGFKATVSGYTEENGYPDIWAILAARRRSDHVWELSACQVLPRSTTSAVITGLKPGLEYNVNVFANSTCNHYVDVVSKKVTTTSLTADANATTATLTLNHHDGDWWHQEVVGGGVGTAGTANTSSGAVCTPAGNGSTATLSNLTAGTNYTYGAYGAATCSENDELATATFTTQFDTAPDPVAAVTAAHQGSSLAVSWDAPARATHYHVTYTGDNGTSWQLGALEHAGTSLTINGVDSTKTYLVGVRAKNTAGSSGWTNSAAATFTAPDPVASVTVAHQGSSLAVSWPAAARATHYHVTYTGDNGTSWQLGALEHAGTSLTINGVDSTKTYLVGVRAKNAAGSSGWVNSTPAAPPALSVANATAAEPEAGESTTLDFVVTLNRAASATVTLDYATSDGTATAGADYTAASGTLSFAVGETSKTVSVLVLDDSHNEGSETMTLTLSNATGAVINSNAAQATGTITNNDPIPQAWISRFGRTVADQVLEAVDTRLRSTSTPGLEVTLAGERLGWLAEPDETQPVAEQAVAQLAQWLVVGNGDKGDIAARTVTGSELLAHSSFDLSSRTAGGGLLSFWGRGAVTSFEGSEGDLNLDGEVTTWMLGTDWSWGQWPDGQDVTGRSTAGLLLSRSTSDGGWGYTGTGKGSSGDVEATLTGVFPWGRHRFTDRLEAWAAAGYGQGELQVTPKLPGTDKDGATLTTDLNLWLLAGGLRGTLLDGGNDGLTLTGKTDAMAVRTTSQQVTGLDSAQATVTRLRLGLEAHRPFTLGHPEAGSGATLTPSLEVGLRHDGGDAETGFGIDIGGGIVLSHPDRGLEAELRGRGLSPTQRRVSAIVASPLLSPGDRSRSRIWVPHCR